MSNGGAPKRRGARKNFPLPPTGLRQDPKAEIWLGARPPPGVEACANRLHAVRRHGSAFLLDVPPTGGLTVAPPAERLKNTSSDDCSGKKTTTTFIGDLIVRVGGEKLLRDDRVVRQPTLSSSARQRAVITSQRPVITACTTPSRRRPCTLIDCAVH